jgi:hypothetical protein
VLIADSKPSLYILHEFIAIVHVEDPELVSLLKGNPPGFNIAEGVKHHGNFLHGVGLG